MKTDTRHTYFASDYGKVILVWSGRNPTMLECTVAVARQREAISKYFPKQLFVLNLGHLEKTTPSATP